MALKTPPALANPTSICRRAAQRTFIKRDPTHAATPSSRCSTMSSSAGAAPAPDAGNESFIIACSALVLIMSPALGMFYGGLSRSRDVMTMMLVCTLSMAVVTLQWWLIGYSLALSPTATNTWIGDAYNALLFNMNGSSPPMAPAISDYVYFLFQLKFAVITPALFVGAGAGRLRVFPLLILLVVWTTAVYDPLIYSVWGLNGWLRTLGGTGVYDYAGGIGIHTASGVAAWAYAIVLGPRLKPRALPAGAEEAHSPILVYIATGLLWFGWLGFNGGSALAANSRAAVAAINSCLAAAVAGLVWMFLEARHTKKLGSIPFCTGIVAGLATVTPGSGFVPTWAALVIGFCAAVVCQTVVSKKSFCGLHWDTLDVMAVHGVGGIIGSILTGIFASSAVISLDGTTLPGGWIEGNWMQVPIQLAGIGYSASYSFVVTYIICRIMNVIPGLQLRVTEEQEHLGLDRTQLGEQGYGYYRPLAAIDDLENADQPNPGLDVAMIERTPKQAE